MYRQMLYAQWLSARQAVVLFMVLAFAAPLFTVYYGGNLASAGGSEVAYWLVAAEKIGRAMPVFALFLGVFVGYAAWAPDHLGKHVYALSLPVPRPMFVLLRFAAGVTLLGAPVLALGLGALVASFAVTLPAGVHAYPVQLTLRFAFATLVTFAIFFALSIGTRRGLLVVLGAVAGVLLADLLLATADVRYSVSEQLFYLLTNWPGPLSILMGRWALFDV